MDLFRGSPSAGRLDFDRLRAAQNRFVIADAEAGSDALPSFLGQVVTSTANLKANRFCSVVPTMVLGQEREGAAGIFATSSGASVNPTKVLVYLMGSNVPAMGDYLVCRFVDHRWVAEATHRGSHPDWITLPSCLCLVPPTLQMVSGDPRCNYGMFQSCSLTYGPPPPSLLPLGHQGYQFTSSAMFDDPISKAKFYYFFFCIYGQFILTRVFPTSPMGTPFSDGLLYTWLVGGYGNTCDPFQLEIGQAYPGSDLSCSVSITGG